LSILEELVSARVFYNTTIKHNMHVYFIFSRFIVFIVRSLLPSHITLRKRDTNGADCANGCVVVFLASKVPYHWCSRLA